MGGRAKAARTGLVGPPPRPLAAPLLLLQQPWPSPRLLPPPLLLLRLLLSSLFFSLARLTSALPESAAAGVWSAADECLYEARWASAQVAHRAIDAFLERGLCRLDAGMLCQRGRDGRPFAEGRGDFEGSDGEWAVSGHSGESQLHTRFLFDIAFKVRPRRLCEVGFNVGHSAATMLTAAGNASYLGFDLARLNPGANEELFSFLKAMLRPKNTEKKDAQDFQIIWGDASDTLRGYPVPIGGTECDLLFYDGAHDVLSVLVGLSLLRRIASGPRARIIVDDVHCSGPLCGHSTLAWDFLVWAGRIKQLECRNARSRHHHHHHHRHRHRGHNLGVDDPDPHHRRDDDDLDEHQRPVRAGLDDGAFGSRDGRGSGDDDEDDLVPAEEDLGDFGACIGQFQWGPKAARCPIFDAWCVARSYQEPYRPEEALFRSWRECCFDSDSDERIYHLSARLGRPVRLVGP